MKRHINIPVFIPHLGCPNACVFCNQRQISGKTSFELSAVRGEIERACATFDPAACDAEIAFFGGSFTGIDRGDMLTLLGIAKEFIDAGKVKSIRLSTRPDYIDGEILDILAAYGVTDIELGLQSMSDAVLTASRRGHTAEAAREACRMIAARGCFSLAGQMMIGLPGSSRTDELETAREITRLGCTAARIYPTVVFSETELCGMMRRGEYRPLTLADAVERSLGAFEIFLDAGLPVIRLGLCAADNLFAEGTIAGGAYHSAFGELVMGALYRKRTEEFIEAHCLAGTLCGKTAVVTVPRRDLSKAAGQKRCNAVYLCEKYGAERVKLCGDDVMPPYTVTVRSE